MYRHISRMLPLGLAVWLVSISFVLAQTKPGSSLEEVRQRQQIAAQALEQKVKDALKESDQLRNDPGKALDILRAVLAELDADKNLSSSRRATLRTQIKDRMEVVQSTVVKRPEPVPSKEPLTKEEAAFQRELQAVQHLRRMGDLGPAQKLADVLAKRYPDSVQATQTKRLVINELQVRENYRLLDDKAMANLAAMRQVDRAAIPMTTDIEYPADWKEKSERRLKKYREGMVPLSPREKAILNSLNEVTKKPVDFKNASFEEVLDYLRKELGQPILVDRNAMKELDITYETKISAYLPKEVARRTALRILLSELGLTYIVKEEMIQITSPLRAQNELTTRFYPLDDVFSLGVPFGFAFNPQFRALSNAAKAEQLIETIKSLVEPGSWRPNGPGTITYEPITNTLIIRNTAEVINSLGGGLTRR